jgi:hypothetical protein
VKVQRKIENWVRGLVDGAIHFISPIFDARTNLAAVNKEKFICLTMQWTKCKLKMVRGDFRFHRHNEGMPCSTVEKKDSPYIDVGVKSGNQRFARIASDSRE